MARKTTKTNKFKFHSPKKIFIGRVECYQVVPMKNVFNVDNVFSHFHSYNPLLKMDMVHLNLFLFINSGCFVPSLVEIDPVFLNNSVLMLSMHFWYSLIYYILFEKTRGEKSRRLLFEQSWNSIHSMMLCAKYCWN